MPAEHGASRPGAGGSSPADGVQPRGGAAMAADEPAVHVLWTSGWDSTFYVLWLLATRPGPVQPWYVVDRGRLSWDIELRTVNDLTDACRRRPDRFIGRLLDIITVDKEAIPPDDDLTAKYRALRAGGHVDLQYAFLPRLAHQHAALGLGLCVHKDDYTQERLQGLVEKVEHNGVETYRMKPEVRGDITLYRDFTFPVFELSKLDMQRIAGELGFADLMERTWFCQSPLRKRWPCGTCVPCIYTIKEGMGRRIGWRGMLRRHTVGRLKEALPTSLLEPLRTWNKHLFRPDKIARQRQAAAEAARGRDGTSIT